MFGYYRFFLASLVLLSHTGITLHGLNFGVSAVVSFYILAGFVVSHLFAKIFVSVQAPYFLFYYERALRIFPLYLFISLLTLIFVGITQYGEPTYNFTAIINNILIIPLNYYMLIDNSILQEPKWWLIPPAWSLGVELQAYLFLPFILHFKPVKIILATASLFIFLMANIGILHTDYFGYRLLPGVLFMFILGISIHNRTSQESKADLFDSYFPIFVYVILLFLMITLSMQKMLHTPFIRETILGILIGLPLISHMAKRQSSLPLNHFIGNLSYGLFLSHFLAIWMIDNYAWADRSSHPGFYFALLFAISVTISLLGLFLIERKIQHYRFNFFNKEKNAGNKQ